jgi:hypothetical protein
MKELKPTTVAVLFIYNRYLLLFSQLVWKRRIEFVKNCSGSFDICGVYLKSIQ